MSPLTTKQIAHLRAQGQRLEPMAHIGQAGLSDAVLASVNQALDAHELVKVKFHAFKEKRKPLAAELAGRTGSVLVQQVGHVVVLYRAAADPAARKIQLS
ncbi:MAG TPA: YhbY family RNA-binding protein [Verrucomicrobiota bacterium]|nr:YhbY family RNA-binding protein [Verrucomicrobiota bacterium]HNT14646.1 YhbY family RNA-binding protein [Verrucomicrobiota bacterium]